MLEREAAEHNAAMTSQMTERFSAPGATLVKLFGRPDEEAEEFGARAARVRDIGVRSAHGHGGLHAGADPRVRPGPRADLRARRLPRPAGRRSTPAPSSRWRCSSTGCTPRSPRWPPPGSTS